VETIILGRTAQQLQPFALALGLGVTKSWNYGKDYGSDQVKEALR